MAKLSRQRAQVVCRFIASQVEGLSLQVYSQSIRQLAETSLQDRKAYQRRVVVSVRPAP